jgi:hypothetical protein
MSLPANLLDATQANLDELVTSGTVEGPHIDFKPAKGVAYGLKPKAPRIAFDALRRGQKL